MNEVKVSVIVPVHNNADTIERTLASVEAQTYRDFEVICVDDGSTDDTAEVLRALAQRWDNMRIVSKPCGGVSSARNRGMDEARGTFIQFVDADDTIDDCLLEKAVAAAGQHASQMMIFGFDESYNQGAVLVPRRICEQDDLYGRAFTLEDVEGPSTLIVTPNVWRILFDRSFLQNEGILFHEDLPTAEDLAFIYEALLCAQRIALLPDRMYHYNRDNESSLTRKERGCTGLSALDYVFRFGTERNVLGKAQTRHLVNLVVDTLEYALSTAYSSSEFSALYQGYQTKWSSFVAEHEADIAPRYVPFYQAICRYDEMGYLFSLYTQKRDRLEKANTQLRASKKALSKKEKQCKKLRAQVKRLERRPFNRCASWVRRKLSASSDR